MNGKSFVHQGFEAYNKLLHTEWFFQIVISSQFKSFYYIIDVAIPAEEIIPENFNSAKALYDLIVRLEDE